MVGYDGACFFFSLCRKRREWTLSFVVCHFLWMSPKAHLSIGIGLNLMLWGMDGRRRLFSFGHFGFNIRSYLAVAFFGFLSLLSCWAV
jgi:hypothetical protein